MVNSHPDQLFIRPMLFGRAPAMQTSVRLSLQWMLKNFNR
jgi:hypothetical protein